MGIIDAAYGAFCQERFPLPSEQQVAYLEKRIGVLLPEDYRQFLIEFNGGFFTEPDIVPPVDECPLDGLTSMKGIGATHPSAELATEADLATFDDNTPLQILPIGYTLMGNMLLLVTSPEYNACILLKKSYSDEYYLLAEGIEEFFERLREPLDE